MRAVFLTVVMIFIKIYKKNNVWDSKKKLQCRVFQV